MSDILEIKHLRVQFFHFDSGQWINSVDDISLRVPTGKVTAIVGQSGSGKSVTCRSIFHLIDSPGRIVDSEIWFDGKNLLEMHEKDRVKIYGNDIYMIFQDCASSLNPVYRVRKQMFELLKLHHKYKGRKASEALCCEALKRAHLPNPASIMDKYPFELSGGMCQRVMIAMALLVKPKLLVADEPTTSLDLTIQAGILDELRIMNENGVSILLITHDLGVVSQLADYVYVMEDGKIVEEGTVYQIFDHPTHAYTQKLLQAASISSEVTI